MKTGKKNEKGEEVKTTIWPMMAESCMACWNKPLTADESQTAPRSHGIVVSLPVHLVERNGNTTIVCYVARCMTCGTIRHYGSIPGIYKNSYKPDFNIAKWPEILRNEIDPMKFEEAILNAEQGPIWLNAKELQKAKETRERAPFYEPAYA